MKQLIYEFDPVIYPYNFWVIIDKTPNVISSNFNEYNGNEITTWENTENLSAFVMPVRSKVNPKYGVVIYFRSRKSITFELVAHESSHAVKYLFEHIGANIKEHEPSEYVIGWLASCIEKIKLNKI